MGLKRKEEITRGESVMGKRRMVADRSLGNIHIQVEEGPGRETAQGKLSCWEDGPERGECFQKGVV